MAKEVLLTQKGLEALKNELEELKTVRRKEISEKIKNALAFGDLSENSEYEEAKNEQGLVETRILEIENMLKNAKIIDEKRVNTNYVHIGCRVELERKDNGKFFEYKIVGSSEANPAENRISDESPVGRALLDKTVGETVEVRTPKGISKYKIVKISN
jgi:transcription elongation factor GreA